MSYEDIVVDPAFTGPPSVAQGGYACGRLARFVPGVAEVTLRRPVPLGVALRVESRDDGAAMYDGSALVATAESSRVDLAVPAPPTLAEASEASAGFPGFATHPFPGCLVCGTDRSDDAALQIFPGPLAGRDLLAAVWRPGKGAVSEGVVRTEFVWAALDCPGGWAAAWCATRSGPPAGPPAEPPAEPAAEPPAEPAAGPAVLGRMTARIYRPVPADDASILVGWLIGRSGRKLDAASALFSASGTVLGLSRQTWITLANGATR